MFQTKNVVINNTGFDFGGSATLGREFRKLGFKTYFKAWSKKKDRLPEELAEEFNVEIYQNLEDIIPELIKLQPEKIIFNIPTYDKIEDKVYAPIWKIKESLNTELILLHCSRADSLAKKEVAYFKEKGVPYDKIYCISEACVNTYRQVCSNVEVLDFNVFTFRDKIEIIPFQERDKILFSNGRVESIKGTTRYLSHIDKLLRDLEEYTIIHEGADFKISKKSGKVSSAFHIVDLLTEDLKTKKIKDFVELHSDYSTSPIQGKVNYYPTYDYELAKQRWKKNLALVYPVLGIYKDKPMKEYIRNKHLSYWSIAKEYALLEVINEGTIVFLSKDFAKLFDINIPEIIYKNFDEIPMKLKNINEENYLEIMEKLIKQFKEQQEKVNQNIFNLLG